MEPSLSAVERKRLYDVEYRKRNRDKKRVQQQAWEDKHRERVTAKNRAYRLANPEAARRAARKYRHGISDEQYQEMLDRQGHVCAICSRPERRKIHGSVTALCVDHHHDSGKIRQLLCRDCNSALGYASEDIVRLQRMIDYLKEHADGTNSQ